jgi:hypothetical protein
VVFVHEIQRLAVTMDGLIGKPAGPWQSTWISLDLLGLAWVPARNGLGWVCKEWPAHRRLGEGGFIESFFYRQKPSKTVNNCQNQGFTLAAP